MVTEQKSVNDEKKSFLENILRENMRSSGENYMNWYKQPSGGIIGNLALDDFRDDDYFEIDIVKAYPFAISKSKSLPVDNEFDKPRKYDGGNIEYYTSYLVEYLKRIRLSVVKQ